MDSLFDQFKTVLTGVAATAEKIHADVTRLRDERGSMTAEQEEEIYASLLSSATRLTEIDDLTPEPVVEGGGEGETGGETGGETPE